MKEWEATHPQTCYVGGENRLNKVAEMGAYGITALGSQPLWHPARFIESFNSHHSLREQRRRARAKGVTVHEWDPATPSDTAEIRSCLQAWLAKKPIPNMRFLVEPDVFSFAGDRKVFVAMLEGEVCGFVVLCPIPSRNGWLTEDFVRHPNAPNGTMELALYEAISSVQDASLVTMGMCPLSRQSQTDDPIPGWLRLVSRLGRRVGRVFYNFQGLEDFKAKFGPNEWEAVTIVRAGGAVRPSDLSAVVQAFTGYHPLLMPWHYMRRRLGPPIVKALPEPR